MTKSSKAAPRAPAQDAAKPATATNPLAPPGASAQDHERLASTTGEGAGQPRARKKLEESVSVTVPKGFHLTDDTGMRHTYEPGVQDMPASHAKHWYAAANGVEINE